MIEQNEFKQNKLVELKMAYTIRFLQPACV